MPRRKWDAVAGENEFTRRRSSLLRVGFRCLAEPLRLPDGFRSLLRVRERIVPSCLPFCRHDLDHDEIAKASESPLRVQGKRHWKSNRGPSRCALCIPDRCTASRESERRCRGEIEPTQRGGPSQFLSFASRSIVVPVLRGGKTDTAGDRGETQLNRHW